MMLTNQQRHELTTKISLCRRLSREAIEAEAKLELGWGVKLFKSQNAWEELDEWIYKEL